MKKLLVLVSLLIAAAACSTTPPGNKDITANANSANANKGAEMKSTATVSESDIIAKEKGSWDAIKKKDWDGLARMVAADYIEVLDDGVHDKTSSMTGVKDFDLSDVTFADWKMLPIGKHAAIITYTATVKAKYKGEAVPPGPYREVSAWVSRNGEWVTAYYQETLVRTAPPPSSPAPPPSKSPSSPMTKPAETGPDAIANEKLVWDALKSRNADAFAGYLANDFMEVEADGVYDKTGSVKATSMFDFSKTALADWKSLKFDDDAALVTYTIVTPGMKPEKEYHATVWVKRDNKWLGLFHQGTPAGVPPPAKPEMKKM